MSKIYNAFARVGMLEPPTTVREIAAIPAADPELARRTAASMRRVTGPPAIPWEAALDLERSSQIWSMRRKALGP